MNNETKLLPMTIGWSCSYAKSLERGEWVNVVGEFESSTALINNLPKLDAHVLITDLSNAP